MALDELLDEHEQSERVQKWLRDNALSLMGGLVIGLGLIGSWTWWNNHRHAQTLARGDAYQAVVSALQSGDLDAADRAATGLHEGAYAELIALDLAKAHVDKGDLDAAIAALRRAESAIPGVQWVITRRLARLLVANEQADEALALLGDADDAASLEIRGDALFAQGKPDDARSAYQDALRKLDSAAPQRMVLEFKLIEVGGTPEQREEGQS